MTGSSAGGAKGGSGGSGSGSGSGGLDWLADLGITLDAPSTSTASAPIAPPRSSAGGGGRFEAVRTMFVLASDHG
jgi:hypothetical protein